MAAKYEIDTTTNPTDDRSGLAKIEAKRVGGQPGNNIFLLYRAEDDVDSGFDIAISTLAAFKKATGGFCLGRWEVIATPKDGHLGCAGVEINMAERSGDKGLLEKRGDGPFTVAIQITPENAVSVGDGQDLCSTISFGLAFTPAAGTQINPDAARIHCPIVIEPGAIADNGVGIIAHGKADDQVNAPSMFAKIIGKFKKGISFLRAQLIDNVALELAAGQKIDLGNGTTISQEPTTGQMFINIGSKLSIYETNDEVWALFRKSDGNNIFKRLI